MSETSESAPQVNHTAISYYSKDILLVKFANLTEISHASVRQVFMGLLPKQGLMHLKPLIQNCL